MLACWGIRFGRIFADGFVKITLVFRQASHTQDSPRKVAGMSFDSRLALQHRWRLWMFASWMVLVALAVGPTAALFAQDEKAEPAATEEAAPAGEAPAEGAAEEGEGGEEGGKKEEESFLWWLIETSGAIGGVLLVLSIYFVATVIGLFRDFKQDLATPPDIVTNADDLVQKKDFGGLFKLLKGDESFFSRVLAAGLTELPHGLTEAREAMDLTGELETVTLEKRISMLAVIGSLGPMIGLLGTLKGMIASFSVIAISDTQLKASEVAGGISEALLLTFEGVGLSVPAVFFFTFFRNRVMSISATTMLRADEFIRKVNAAARSKAPGTPA
jgi:biopolymer transport protein ExbB